MKLIKPSADLIAEFKAVQRELSEAQPRKMFGYDALFVHGNMAIGLWQDTCVAKLSASDQQQLLAAGKAKPFMPAPGRPMSAWLELSEELAHDPEELLESAPAAAADAVGVAVRGYVEAPRYETVLFNLLAGFLGSFALVRLSTWAIHDGHGPFRNVHIGGRHIHHFVPGILLAFGSGATAILTDNEQIEPRLALVFGTGMGLTLDESALLLELDDVYWSDRGIVSVQITLAAIALLSAASLARQALRRGANRVPVGFAATPPPQPPRAAADPSSR